MSWDEHMATICLLSTINTFLHFPLLLFACWCECWVRATAPEPQASHLTRCFTSEYLLNDECAPDEYSHPLHSQRTSFSALLWLPSYPGVWLQSQHYLYCLWIKVCAQSCLTLCNPMNCSLPGSFCPWDFPGSGLPCLLSGDLPDPGLKPMSFVSPALAGRFFTTALSGKPPMNTGTYYSPSLSKVCLRARKQLMWTVWEPGLGPHPGWFSNPCL